MNISQTAHSAALIFPAAKQAAKSIKPSYKTACRIAFCINLTLASAFMASFPLLRIADDKSPAAHAPLPPLYQLSASDAERICLWSNRIASNRLRSDFSVSGNHKYRHARFEYLQKSSASFQKAHKDWRFDW